jgi:glycine/D-amino acid oxidase-like deaminating enzyme
MVTNKKDLRGGHPVWADDRGPKVRTMSRLISECCDIAVVGGGVSGALIALTLSRAGFDVVVVDRREPGSGSTAASTAMIQFELDTPLRELSEKIGAAKAGRTYHRSLKAVADLKAFTIANKISCDWRSRNALYLSGDVLGSRGLKQEAIARQRADLPSHFIDAGTLKADYAIDRTGAIVSEGAAELNPAKLTLGALRVAHQRGCRIYAPQEVVSVTSDKAGVRLATKSGGSIACQKVVFATGYETIKSLPASQFDITSSWAIATQRLEAKMFWPTRCLIWEASDPYFYVRSTADGRIVAGGEDSDLRDAARRDAAIKNKAKSILSALNTLLPGRDLRAEYAWAGAFAVSPTGMPIFQEVDGMRNCMAILGCGGNGITFSMIAAQVVSHWAKGKRDPDAGLFENAGK